MPRKPKDNQPAESQQPALFLPGDFPSMPALVESAKRYLHTGKIACKDEERAEAIITHYLATGSLLATAKRFHASPNTVKAVLGVAEQMGKLDDLKQRLSSKLGTVAEMATDAMQEALLAGKVPANVLPIMAGVAVEKKALLDGEATSRTETVQALPVALDDIAKYLKDRGVKAPAIDVESTVSSTEPQQIEGKP